MNKKYPESKSKARTRKVKQWKLNITLIKNEI